MFYIKIDICSKEEIIYFKTTHVLYPIIILSVFLFFILFFNLAAVSASDTNKEYWPTEHWQQSVPEAQGMDSQKLMEVIPYIVENLRNIQSLMVVKNGYVVLENYYGPGMPNKQETVHSVTKSVTSALVGIAKDKGLIGDLGQKLSDFFPEYFDETENLKKNITLQHLLTMTAGLKPVRVKNWSLMMQFIFAPDQTRFTLDLPVMNSPGEKFSYSNPISDLLSMILTKRTGMNVLEFADKNLFAPLGIQSPIWKMNSQGNNIGHGGLYLNTRDLAKIGFLYLNNGYWDGKQIISRQWIEESTRAHVKASDVYSYGYQWWVKPVFGCPSFRAWGRNGQFIVVVPALDLVVAVTSETSMPGYSSENYSPLFDIIANAVVDRGCGQSVIDGKVFCGQKNLPDDIKDFLENFSNAIENKNIDKILEHYSDNFLDYGRRKGATAKFLRISTQAIHKFSFQIDQCRIKKNKAKIWGEIDSNMGPMTLAITDLVKEKGSWKWYGNQLNK